MTTKKLTKLLALYLPYLLLGLAATNFGEASSTLYFANIANGTAPTDCIAAIYPIYGAICFHRFFVDIYFIFWRLFGI